jgi:ketosteroid isomerase-like protein
MSVDHRDEEQALLGLEQVWVRAETERDADTLRRILDDRFVATFSSGQTVDKTEFIALICGSPTTMLSHDLADRRVIVAGDAAVIVDTDTIRGTRNGEAHRLVARLTTTYVKRDGEWRILAEHLTALPAPK